MKKRKPTHGARFRLGELYLFHTSDPRCPAESSLWGFVDTTKNHCIYLEHSTTDHRTFAQWHQLPAAYRYARRATRAELRDYMYNLGFCDGSADAKKAVPKSEQPWY